MMWTYYAIVAGGSLFSLLVIGLILSRLYTKASSEQAFVRTGYGGQRVVVKGGALALPIFHDLIWVNMNTLRLEVRRANEQALITKDRMRVDVAVEFYVRVKANEDSIATAAQTLGQRTQDPDALRTMFEGKGVDALRAVAAQMTMKELHEQRADFAQRVQAVVAEDLHKNGLELESVSLTALDQTKREYFDPTNAFDAEGLAKLTEEIESRRKYRNAIEQDTEVAIKEKNLEAQRRTLEVEKQVQQAKLEQERELAALRAAQEAEVQRTQAEGERLGQEAKILSDRQVAEARILAEREVGEAEAHKRQLLETAQVAAKTAIQMAEQDNAIQVANKSRQESEAKAAADLARAEAVRAAEEVETVRMTSIAERDKAIQLIEAAKSAEQEAIALKVAAEAEKEAAGFRAEALLTEAEAQTRAAKLRADGALAEKQSQAEGTRQVNEAENVLSLEQIAMRVRLALIEALPDIIAASVKPMERIESIRIAEVGGLAAGTGDGADSRAGEISLSDQVVKSAMRYRAQAPLVDALLKEVGLDGQDLRGVVQALSTNTPGSLAAQAEPREIEPPAAA